MCVFYRTRVNAVCVCVRAKLSFRSSERETTCVWEISFSFKAILHHRFSIAPSGARCLARVLAGRSEINKETVPSWAGTPDEGAPVPIALNRAEITRLGFSTAVCMTYLFPQKVRLNQFPLGWLEQCWLQTRWRWRNQAVRSQVILPFSWDICKEKALTERHLLLCLLIKTFKTWKVILIEAGPETSIASPLYCLCWHVTVKTKMGPEVGHVPYFSLVRIFSSKLLEVAVL